MRFAAIAFVASMAAFQPAARAQDETLVLDDGFTLTGRVVSCSADGVEFEHRDEKGGKVVTKFATADVDPDDYYTLRAPKCASAQDQLDLAKFAVAHDMWARALLHYDRARELDPKLIEAFDSQELPALRQKTGDRVLEAAKKAFEAGDLAAAERDASVVVVVFRKYARRDEAQKLLDEVRKKAGSDAAEQTPADRARARSGKSTTLLLRNGRRIDGTVKSSTNAGIEVLVPLKSTEAVITYKTKDVDPASFYAVRVDAVKTAAEHLELAQYCLENGLFTEARAQGQLAHKADPALAKSFADTKLAKIEEGTADKLLAKARAALEAGDYATARRDVAAILTRFGDTPSAKPAGEMVHSIAKAVAEGGDAERAAARAKLSAEQKAAAEKADAERARLFAESDELMAKGQKKSQEGFDLGSKNDAPDLFDEAAAAFLKARTKLTELKQQKGSDKELAPSIDQRLATATEEAIEAYVNAGSKLLARPDYHNAMGYADKALAIDPKSSYALAFRARVEEASASDDDRWGPFRRRR
jgi:tetratricopeptide (TPR) repeat protein